MDLQSYAREMFAHLGLSIKAPPECRIMHPELASPLTRVYDDVMVETPMEISRAGQLAQVFDGNP